MDVIKNDSTGQVRAETNDYLIAFGVTGSVPESIQLATTQLATWIKRNYKLSDSEVAILFASTLKLDITELVDAHYQRRGKGAQEHSGSNEIGGRRTNFKNHWRQ